MYWNCAGQNRGGFITSQHAIPSSSHTELLEELCHHENLIKTYPPLILSAHPPVIAPVKITQFSSEHSAINIKNTHTDTMLLSLSSGLSSSALPSNDS